MLEKDAILCFILLFTFLRAVIKRFRGNFDTNYLFISLFVIAAPFNFEWPLKKLIAGKAFETYDLDYLSDLRILPGFGTFGSSININISLIIIAILILFGFYKFNFKSFTFKENKWLYVLLVFCVISYFNPYNIIPISIFPLLAYLLQFFLLFKFIASNFSKDTILKGTFDGLLVLTAINLLLTVCFPILSMDWAATFIYGKITLINAERREGFPAAAGMFVHPVPLGIFTLIPIAFFTSCYLKSYKSKNLSTILILVNLFICFFTFSRTSYLSVIISIVILLIIYYKRGKVLLPKKAVTFAALCLGGLVVLYVYLALFGNLMLFKNADQMLSFREVHWNLAYKVWQQSVLIGVGLNSNVYFIQHRDLISNGSDTVAALNYAIHNVHLTVLAETGLVGLIVWVYFLVVKFKELLTFKAEPGYFIFDIFKMAFFAILIGAFLIFGSFNPFPYSILSLILFFGYFAGITLK